MLQPAHGLRVGLGGLGGDFPVPGQGVGEVVGVDEMSASTRASWTLTSCWGCAGSTSTTILKSTASSGRARRSACGWPRSGPPGRPQKVRRQPQPGVHHIQPVGVEPAHGLRVGLGLRPCPGESVDWEHTRNLYIEGDNLEVLKLLQTAYYRKIKEIASFSCS